MKELNEQELNMVSGGGIVYELFYFIGEVNAGWDKIDWSSISTPTSIRE